MSCVLIFNQRNKGVARFITKGPLSIFTDLAVLFYFV
jgi:hypothetical protein